MRLDSKSDSSAVRADATRAEAEALLKGITDPPWAWEWIAEKSNEWAVGQAFREDGTAIEGRIPDNESVEDTVIERRLIGMNESGHASAADAEFIAASPRLVRGLLDILAQRDARLAAIVQEMREFALNLSRAAMGNDKAKLLGFPAPTIECWADALVALGADEEGK